MTHVLFVFLDGVGLGPPGADNPLAARTYRGLSALTGGQPWTAVASSVRTATHTFHPIDATLGVEGLPQSGTGQATLFTGVNCAAVAGRHYGPFPHSKTRPILAAENIFVRTQALGLSHEEPAAFANAYPARFFQYVARRDRWTVTTRCCLDAGLRIRSTDDLLAGRALPANLTGEGWPEPGVSLPRLTEADAAAHLARMTERHAFLLFEYFLTDKAGHSQSAERADAVLTQLDAFFGALVDALAGTDVLLVVTSDHGNLEDLSTRSHTVHPVPLIALGPEAGALAGVRDLTGVTPAILRVLGAGAPDALS